MTTARTLMILATLAFASPALAYGKFRPTSAQKADILTTITDVCPPLISESYYKDAIREEHANPAGVVDLAKLHELGAALADARVELAAARKAHKSGLVLYRKYFGEEPKVDACMRFLESQSRD